MNKRYATDSLFSCLCVQFGGGGTRLLYVGKEKKSPKFHPINAAGTIAGTITQIVGHSLKYTMDSNVASVGAPAVYS